VDGVNSACPDADTYPTDTNVQAIEGAILCVINQQRAKFHLHTVTLSARLSRAALAHSRAMVSGRFFGHQGPGEPSLPARLHSVNYFGTAGENVGAGAGPLSTPNAMVRGWMTSPGHRFNLLYPRWRAVGIGFIPRYPVRTPARPAGTFTTDFGVKP
jgi:uncharacterized protein YkwD